MRAYVHRVEVKGVEPHPARIYGYWLGGKDHFAADRAAADRIATVAPCVATAVRANRVFVSRAVTAMVGQGVHQFLDLGCGLPTVSAVHDVARRAGSYASVVYVDRDDTVLAHARAAWDGVPGVLIRKGDLREPARLLSDRPSQTYLDLSRPVGVLLTGVLHAVDDDEVADTLAQLHELLEPGSYLALTQVSVPEHRAATTREAARLHRELVGPCWLRSPDRVAEWFDGWSLIEPGLTDVASWRGLPGRSMHGFSILAGVGRRLTGGVLGRARGLS